MTKQQYLDLLLATSRAGSFPSYGGGGWCAYRGKDGRKCAVGLLIPDEKYDPNMERKTATMLLKEYPEAVTTPGGMSENDLFWVQDAHDQLAFDYQHYPWSHDEFERRLLGLKCFAGLTPPVEA